MAHSHRHFLHQFTKPDERREYRKVASGRVESFDRLAHNLDHDDGKINAISDHLTKIANTDIPFQVTKDVHIPQPNTADAYVTGMEKLITNNHDLSKMKALTQAYNSNSKYEFNKLKRDATGKVLTTN